MKGLFSILTLLASAVAAFPANNPPNSGQLITDLGPGVKQTITVTGQDSQELLVQLSPEVASVVAGLGLTTISGPVGSVVKTAANVGDLLEQLSTPIQGTLTVTGEDSSILLVQLSPSVASLIAGLGLEGASAPVGKVVATLGDHVKRQTTGKLLEDLGPKVDSILVITGTNAQKLLIELSPEVAALLGGLGLTGLGAPLGTVVAEASSLGDLIAGLGPDVQGLLTAVAQGGRFLLVSLDPAVVGLVSGLGLPSVGTPVGSVLLEVADHL